MNTPEPLHTRVAARAAQLRRNAHLAAQEGKVDAREWNWMIDTAALLEEVGEKGKERDDTLADAIEAVGFAWALIGSIASRQFTVEESAEWARGAKMWLDGFFDIALQSDGFKATVGEIHRKLQVVR